MKKVAIVLAVAVLMTPGTVIAAIVGNLFNDEDRTTLNVRSDGSDDYAYNSPLYTNLRAYEGVDPAWTSVSLPFASINKDGTPFNVLRNPMETMRFYLVAKDSRYNDGDDPNFQIDNIKLTKDAGGELLIDDFSGALKWSYHQHPSPSSPPSDVTVSIVGGVLDVQVTDIDARAYGANWEMNYIDIFSCDANKDSFIFGDDWSAYDNLTFDWRALEAGTNRTYMDLYVRTDVIPEPATIFVWGLLGLVAAGYGVWRRRRAA